MLDTMSVSAASSPSLSTKGHKGCRRAAHKWTSEETSALLNAVQLHGARNWRQIAVLVGSPDKDAYAAYQHYHRVVSPTIRRARFSLAELHVMCWLVHRIGTHSWATISQELGRMGFPGRTDTQLRTRWLEIAKKQSPINSMLWEMVQTADEAAMLEAAAVHIRIAQLEGEMQDTESSSSGSSSGSESHFS